MALSDFNFRRKPEQTIIPQGSLPNWKAEPGKVKSVLDPVLSANKDARLLETVQNIPGSFGEQIKAVGSSVITPAGLSITDGGLPTSFIPGLSSANLPQSLNASISSTGETASTNLKVRLVSVISLTKAGSGQVEQVIFEVTPTFSVSGGVEYTTITPIHMPGGIQVYKHTNSRTFEITARFISRNTADAMKNILYRQLLWGWRYPYFGQSSTKKQNTQNQQKTSVSTGTLSLTESDKFSNQQQQIQGGNNSIELLGAPPNVLYLYAYSTQNNDNRQNSPAVNINRVPVVITDVRETYPDDVDYIPIQMQPNSNTEPFPVKMEMSISLIETHSPREYEQFNISDFKRGKLVSF